MPGPLATEPPRGAPRTGPTNSARPDDLTRRMPRSIRVAPSRTSRGPQTAISMASVFQARRTSPWLRINATNGRCRGVGDTDWPARDCARLRFNWEAAPRFRHRSYARKEPPLTFQQLLGHRPPAPQSSIVDTQRARIGPERFTACVEPRQSRADVSWPSVPQIGNPPSQSYAHALTDIQSRISSPNEVQITPASSDLFRDLEKRSLNAAIMSLKTVALVHNSRSRSIIALHPEIRGPA